MSSETLSRPSPPMVVLCGTALDEMELLAGGLLAPANGYCLPTDVPDNWPAPFTLAVPSADAAMALAHNAILLADTDGTPLARLDVTSMAPSSATRHFLAGRLSLLRAAEHPPARDLRLVKPLGPQTGSRTVAAIFSSPPRSPEIALAIVKAKEEEGHLLLVAACGYQPHGQYTVTGLVDELLQCAAEVPDTSVALLVLPAMDPASDGRAQTVLESVANNLGAGTVLNFTDFTQTPPPADSARSQRGAIIFLTGLSGSGKSTLARALAERLQHTEHRNVTVLDGDEVRRVLSPDLDFSQKSREENIRRLGWLAARVSEAGGLVICAPIAPYAQTRTEVRAMAEAVGDFLLVHVSTPLAVCEARDRKGLYARARSGQLAEFTGISAPYEAPEDPDVRVDLDTLSIDAGVAAVLKVLPGHMALFAG